MQGVFNFSRGQFLRFVLFSAAMLLIYAQGMISLTLLLFFELLLLFRFIRVKELLEQEITRRHPAYGGFPGWAKWAITIVAYLAIFMIFKWLLINLILEGIFQVPINEELQGFSSGLQPQG